MLLFGLSVFTFLKKNTAKTHGGENRQNRKTKKLKNKKIAKRKKQADNNPSYSLAENSNQITNESEPPRSGGKGLEFPSRHGSKTDIQAAQIGVSASCWCADNGHADKHRGGCSPLPEHQQQGNGILLGTEPHIT